MILGAFVSSSEVGVYQVATRITLLATFAIAPLTAALAPRVAHLWEHADRTSLARHYVQLTSWTWRLSLPVLTVLLLVPGPALRVFGEGFDAGTSTVVILAGGALAETLAAPSAVVLNQIGRNRLNMVLNVLALGIDVGLNLVLIPVLGIEGAALAWAVALVVPGAMRVISVRRLATGVAPWSRVHAGAALAALVAGLVAWPVTQALGSGGPGTFVAGTAAVVCVYVPIVVVVATRPEEREAAHALALRVTGWIPRPSWARRLRTRVRLRRLPAGRRPLRVAELISPLRYDILVRASFFRLAREHVALRRDDFPAFLRLVKQTPTAPGSTWSRSSPSASIPRTPQRPTRPSNGVSVAHWRCWMPMSSMGSTIGTRSRWDAFLRGSRSTAGRSSTTATSRSTAVIGWRCSTSTDARSSPRRSPPGPARRPARQHLRPRRRARRTGVRLLAVRVLGPGLTSHPAVSTSGGRPPCWDRPPASKGTSVRTRAAEDGRDRLDEESEVEQRGPLVYVLQVEVDPPSKSMLERPTDLPDRRWSRLDVHARHSRGVYCRHSAGSGGLGPTRLISAARTTRAGAAHPG